MTLFRSPGRIAAIVVVLVLFVLPPLWLLLSALKPQSEIFQWPPSLWPEHFTLENFQKTIQRLRERSPEAAYDDRLTSARSIRGVADGADAIDLLAYLLAAHLCR